MIPTWMIEKMKREEAERRRQEEARRPRLEIPLYPQDPKEEQKPEETRRGVITIQIL